MPDPLSAILAEFDDIAIIGTFFTVGSCAFRAEVMAYSLCMGFTVVQKPALRFP